MLNILLVDDDDTDRELFVDALGAAREKYQIFEAANGEEAIAFLNNSSKLPDLIFLDLNMPVKDGRQTLKELKSVHLFKRIPVCIFSTSNAVYDVKNAYDAGANLFLVKPFEFKKMEEVLSGVLHVFSNYVILAKA